MATAIQELKEKAIQAKKARYTSVPSHAIAVQKFSDGTANGLTHCVITWLTIGGHYCSRIQSQGQWRGSINRFTKSTVRKGIGDVMAVINGRTVMIEIKIGPDRLSEAQKKTRADVEASGGLYWVVRSFEEFLKEYKALVNNENNERS